MTATLLVACTHATPPSLEGTAWQLVRVQPRDDSPPPSLDEKLARDLPMVRSSLLRDGQLHLSLMADGGIYSWAPWRP